MHHGSPPGPAPAPSAKAGRFSRALGVPARYLAIASLVVAVAALYRLATRPEPADPLAGSWPGAILPSSRPQPQTGRPEPALPVVGNPAPDFTLPDLSGRPVSLGDFRGRPVLLNFWATWCGPCREEMPRIQAFHEQYRDRVAVVGVDVGESAEQVEAYVRAGGYTWLFLLDEQAATAEKYAVYGLPTTFFLDRDGIIRAKRIGVMSEEQILAMAAAAGVEVQANR